MKTLEHYVEAFGDLRCTYFGEPPDDSYLRVFVARFAGLRSEDFVPWGGDRDCIQDAPYALESTFERFGMIRSKVYKLLERHGARVMATGGHFECAYHGHLIMIQSAKDWRVGQ